LVQRVREANPAAERRDVQRVAPLASSTRVVPVAARGKSDAAVLRGRAVERQDRALRVRFDA
ncbi:MAG: hypothetical protein ACK5QX_06780, partial [bacterium]